MPICGSPSWVRARPIRSTATSIPTSLTPFNDPELGNVYGLEDVTTAFAWSVNPAATQAKITTLLELVPRNPATPGNPGDWRSVRIDEFGNDRNVDVITEREPSDSTTGADNNQDPDSAQFIGWLAPHEKAGDETLRLGFEIHGVVSEAGRRRRLQFPRQCRHGSLVRHRSDVGQSGQRGRTGRCRREHHRAVGRLVLRNSSASWRCTPIPRKIDSRLVNSLRKSAVEFYPESALGEPKDLWSTNVRDAGLRVVLPGSQGTNNTYYVRVRSSNIKAGESRGACRIRPS